MKSTIKVSLARVNKSGFFDGKYYGVNYELKSGKIMRLYAVYNADGDFQRCVRADCRSMAVTIAEALAM